MVENIVLPAFNTVILINSILIILIAYILLLIIKFILLSISERAGQYRITVKMVIPLLKFTVYGIVVYYILANILELSSEHLILFSGLLGAGIGFGLKDMFADIVGGIIIIIEKPYHVGDKIKMGDYYGEVIDIGIRSTRLVTPDDNLVSVPNYLIFTQAVASANAGEQEMMVVIDLFIDHESDSSLALKILKEAIITSKYVYVSRKRPFTVLLKEFPFYTRIRARAYVFDLRNEFEFESEVTRRAWIELHRIGIEAPKVSVVETGEQ